MVEEFRDTTAASNFRCWYTARWLPFHIYASSNTPEEIRTELSEVLLKTEFLSLRFRSCGLLTATLRCLHDAELIIQKNEQNFLLAQTDKDGSLKNLKLRDHGFQLVAPIYISIENILHETKQDIDSKDESFDMFSNEFKQRTINLGTALHYLVTAFGSMGDFKKELDLLVEALRLKNLASEKLK